MSAYEEQQNLARALFHARLYIQEASRAAQAIEEMDPAKEFPDGNDAGVFGEIYDHCDEIERLHDQLGSALGSLCVFMEKGSPALHEAIGVIAKA